MPFETGKWVADSSDYRPDRSYRYAELTELLHQRVSAIVQNTGFLPTYVSEQAKKMGITRPVKATIDLAAGAELVIGPRDVDVGHLDGRANQFGAPSFSNGYPLQSRAIVEWIVRQSGGSVTVTVSSAKAGTSSVEIELEAGAVRGA